MPSIRSMFRRPWLLAGAVFLVVLLGWYFFFRNDTSNLQTMVVKAQEFSQSVSVSGTVVAAQNSDLGFAQSGRLTGVYVSVGQKVSAGQVLAEVENGDLRALLAQKQAALASARANLSSLESGTRAEELAVTQAQVDSDRSALEQARQAVVNAVQSAYTTSDDAIRNKIDQFFTNPRSANPDITFETSNSTLEEILVADRVSIENTLLAWQKTSTALTTADDVLAAAADAQQRLAQMTKILTDSNMALNAAITSQTITQTTLSGYITAVATARSNVNAAISALTTATASAKSAAALLQKDERTLALQKAGATVQSLDAARAQVAAAQADVQSAQAQLTKTQVVAPFTGVVSKMDAKVGQIVSPGASGISLQSSGTFQIECYVPEVSIAAVAIGNTASTTLDAYGPSTFFDAVVISIDPAQTVRNGVSTYKTVLAFVKPDERIRSGMTADITIATGEQPNVLVIPTGAIYLKNGVRIVQVLQGDTVMEREVKTGLSALGNTVVTEGLRDGDVVVLNPEGAK